MTTEETAANICEFAVAKLDVKPGDVVVVKVDGGPELQRQLYEVLVHWADYQGLNLHFLVTSKDFDLTTIHTLTPEELEKAGAGGWPHE